MDSNFESYGTANDARGLKRILITASGADHKQRRGVPCSWGIIAMSRMGVVYAGPLWSHHRLHFSETVTVRTCCPADGRPCLPGLR